MALLYHPGSECYWLGNPEDYEDAWEEILDVTDEPLHEANYKERLTHMTTIDSNVPPPTTRKRRTTKKKEGDTNPAAGLIAALAFVSIAQKKEGTPTQTHCRLNQKWLMASDGVVSVGVPVTEDINACPNTTKLAAALSKCGATLAIGQLNEAGLKINSERFRATVECAPSDSIYSGYPDTAVAPCNDEVKNALEALAFLATEGSERPAFGGVLLQATSCVVTNGSVMLEYWHGVDLPPNCIIPRASINALAKVKKKVTGFGYTPDNSVTFWFEDGSYFKTQLFQDHYPNYAQVFERANGAQYAALPADFFKAVDAVLPFSTNKFVFFSNAGVSSHRDIELGAMYNLLNLPDGYAFNGEWIKALEHFCEHATFIEARQMNFSKGSVRGAIMGGNPSV